MPTPSRKIHALYKGKYGLFENSRTFCDRYGIVMKNTERGLVLLTNEWPYGVFLNIGEDVTCLTCKKKML